LKASASETSKDVEGFTKVPSRRKQTKKPSVALEDPKKPETRNSFRILSSPTFMEDHTLIPSSDPYPSTPVPPPHPSASPSKSTLIRTPASTSTDKNHTSETAIQSSAMEVDASLAHNSNQRSYEEERDKLSLMEEGPESEDLVGLDLLKLEAVCR